MSKPLIIGSRGSDLALWQANFVRDSLKQHGIASEIQIIHTKGDRIQHLSLDKIEGKGFFTKEIEEALIQGLIDVAVHSHKDLETTPPEDLIIAAVSQRADARELLLIRPEGIDAQQTWSLKSGAVVGTSSARRKSQIIHQRPDVHLADIRGNVPTRIQKLRDGHFDAILLAKAGIDRLQCSLDGLHVVVLDSNELVPAPAQGALAIQCRKGDEQTIQSVQSLHDPRTAECIFIERSVLNRLDGGCHLPLGVHAMRTNDAWLIEVAHADLWNMPVRRFTLRATLAHEAIEEILAFINKA